MENQELKDVQGILTRSQKKQKLFGSDLLDGNFLSDQDRRRHDVENDGEDGKILTSDVEEDDTDEVHDELIDLVRDKLYHEFVEHVVDPDKGTIQEVEAKDSEFVPTEDALVEAEDGGSSEEDLDKEEEDALDEKDLELALQAVVCGGGDIPPEMVKIYKKRFPMFWRTHQGLVAHNGKAYDQEEDPEYRDDVHLDDKSSEESSSSDDDADDETIEDKDDINEVKEDIEALTNMVEDMVIPGEDDQAVMGGANATPGDEAILMPLGQAIFEGDVDAYKSDEDPDFVLTGDDFVAGEDLNSSGSSSSENEDKDETEDMDE